MRGRIAAGLLLLAPLGACGEDVPSDLVLTLVFRPTYVELNYRNTGLDSEWAWDEMMRAAPAYFGNEFRGSNLTYRGNGLVYFELAASCEDSLRVVSDYVMSLARQAQLDQRDALAGAQLDCVSQEAFERVDLG